MTEINYNFLDPKDSRDIIEPYLGYDILLKHLSHQRVSLRAFQTLISDMLKRSSFEEKGKKFKLREHHRPSLPFAPNNIRIGIADFFKLGIPNDIATVTIKPADFHGGDLWLNEDFTVKLLQNGESPQAVIPDIQFLLLTIPQHLSNQITRYDLTESGATHLAHKQEFYAKNKPELFMFEGEKLKALKNQNSMIIRSISRPDKKLEKQELKEKLLKESMISSKY